MPDFTKKKAKRPDETMGEGEAKERLRAAMIAMHMKTKGQ